MFNNLLFSTGNATVGTALTTDVSVFTVYVKAVSGSTQPYNVCVQVSPDNVNWTNPASGSCVSFYTNSAGSTLPITVDMKAAYVRVVMSVYVTNVVYPNTSANLTGWIVY